MSENNALHDGIALYQNKDYSASLAFFLSLPENPETDNLETAYYIGLCYAKLERYSDALLYLESVVTSGEDANRVSQCRYLLALIYFGIGRKRLAVFELNKLLEAGYKQASVYASLAYIAWQRNDSEKCLEYYQKSLDCDPDNLTALNGMGYVLACLNRRLTKALAYCKKALELAPRSAACLDSIGWVYYRLGLTENAGKYLLQAHSINPENKEITEHLKILGVAFYD